MNEDKIITKLIEHDERLASLETGVDSLNSKVDRLTTSMDQAMKILLRLDQERIFTSEWIRRIEGDVDRIKQHLHIS